MTISVFLVDDHALFRSGLCMLLEREPDLSVIGEAGDGRTAFELVGDLAPDVIVMDIGMPDMDGIQATRQITSEAPDTKIIALSIHSEKDFVQEMLLAGAVGYILKESAPEEIINGIRVVQNGEIFLSARITDLVVSGYKDLISTKQDSLNEDLQTYSDSLLSTKLYQPGISKHVIPRTRLLDLLDSGCWRPMTLVSAPVGYGKSTLVSQWLSHIDRKYPSSWLSLDEHDNDLRMFLIYLVAAIQKLFPKALEETSLLLKAIILPPLPVLVRTLVNELEKAPQRFILALDNYHNINEDSIHELLIEFLLHPPKSIHLVLISRTDPPFELLKLQASQRISIVRAQALNFTVSETMAYMQEIIDTPVDEQIARNLTQRTEGWVTGLHLITLSIHDSASLTSISKSMLGEQQTLDYLAAEALSRQPDDIQAWLLKTSILDHFCADLCQAVCKTNEDDPTVGLGGEDFIQWLTQSNLFVMSLDSGGKWYRYHHLFQELLLNHLRDAVDSETITSMHMKASHWFAEHNRIEEAIQHARMAGDLKSAAEIIEQNRQTILEIDQWFLLKKWLSLLPEPVKLQRPEILMAQIWIYFYQLNLYPIRSLIERIELILGTDYSNQVLWGEINFFRGYFAYLQGQDSQAIEYLTKSLDLIPESLHHNRGEAELHYALSLHMAGRKNEALDRLHSWLKSKRYLTGIRRTRLWAGIYFIHLLEGNLPEVVYPAQQCHMLATQHQLSYAESWANYIQANQLFMQNDLEAMIQETSWLIEHRYTMHIRAAIDSMCALALCFQLIGETKKAEETYRLLLEYARETDDPTAILIASSCQAHLSLIQGDPISALGWLHTTDLSADAGIMLWWIEVPRLTACRVLIAEGSQKSLRKAITQLISYKDENLEFHNTYQVIVILSLLAQAYHKQDNELQALAALEEALALGEIGGWIQPFMEAGTPIAGLLRRLKKQDTIGNIGDYIDQILVTFQISRSSTSGSILPDQISSLTERELQILRLLSTEITTQEIADHLVVSLATVRTHMKKLYKKLDAHSRMEAVQQGRKLKLI
jgi:LuxR family maltose regulon positive regulatory protein